MKALNLLNRLTSFIQTEYCEIDNPEQDCEECSHYDMGNCPVVLAKQYLEEENYYE